MKKTTMIVGAIALTGMLVTGCSSSKSNSDPVKEWQKERFNAAQIDAAYKAKRQLDIKDVMYKSQQKPLCAALGAPINALAPVPAALYLKVVMGVDELDAQLDGIELVREMNDRTGKFLSAEDKSKMKDKEWVTEEAVLADWAKKDADEKAQGSKADARKVKYEKCCEAIRNSKTETLIPMIQDIIQVQIPKAMEDVQKTLAQVKADMDAGKIKVEATGLELMAGLKCLAATDGAALLGQLKDTGVGASYWLKLANEAKDIKEKFAAMKNVK